MENRFADQVDDRLEDALALLAAGVPLPEVLAGAGDEAEWLAPLLETALETRELRAAVLLPPPTASLQRLLAYGESLAAGQPAVVPVQSDGRRPFSHLWQRVAGPRLALGLSAVSLVVSLVVAFLAGSIVGGSLAVASEGSLPGEVLYPVKRAGETIHLGLTQDPAERQLLLESYNERRVVETEQLLERRRQAPVAFDGLVEGVSPAGLTIDGLEVQIISQTKVEGELLSGARVHIEGVTQPSGKLLAMRIRVIMPALPTPTPSPTSTATPTLTPTPTFTATPTRVLSSAEDTLRLEPTLTPAGALEPPAKEELEVPDAESPANDKPAEEVDDGQKDETERTGDQPAEAEDPGTNDNSGSDNSDNSNDNQSGTDSISADDNSGDNNRDEGDDGSGHGGDSDSKDSDSGKD